MNFDFAYIAHMAISGAATLVLKFASGFSPVYDSLLEAVVQLEAAPMTSGKSIMKASFFSGSKDVSWPTFFATSG